MALKDKLSTEQIARLKRRYEETDQSVVSIASDEGLSETQLHLLKRQEGWRARSAARPRKKASGKKAAGQKSGAGKATRRAPPSPKSRKASKPPPGVVDMPTLIARIRAQLEGALASAQARDPEAGPDETARLMASLTRTLQSLRALEKDTTQDDRRQDARCDDGADAPPLDLAELRRELARRIDLLRQGREDS